MCRKSNLVGTADDPLKCLKRKDIFVKHNVLLVNFNWSKTIQFGERSLQIPLVRNTSSPLCPFTAYVSMCDEFIVPDSASAFVVKKTGVLKPVTYNMFNSFLKNALRVLAWMQVNFQLIVLEGVATWAFKCGVPSDLIQLQGDWKSSAYKLYLRYGLNEKLIVANKIMSYC
ncbi:unnamed protein product [Mytilus coruscus]|uniref:Uncharacterized protein n=1 Tax=Mytilus coruscus TaxID=42192 RepID=A0A6J8BEH6_MYTCO|nr:unnamed protein product [Mytilus coruscus]